MSCGCGCNSDSCEGLGELGKRRGLFSREQRLKLSILGRGLSGLGNVRAGATIKVGFRYSCALCLPGSLPDDPEIKTTVESCLYTSGAYQSVRATISHGIIYQDYLTIEAVTAIEFGQAEDIAGQIQGTLQQCYPDFAGLIDSHDQVLVQQPAAAPDPTGQFAPMPTDSSGKPDPCAVDKDGKPRMGIDYLLCRSGADSAGKGLSTNALIFGLLAVVILSKAFK